MPVRQPIVSMLGHVDHGKTTILDSIRGTTVVEREAGRITQHIGATEVPVGAIKDICGDVLKGMNVTIPGLLFIDTPGHHSFTTLRKRGGSLADLAILVVDIMEGFKPQTIESIRILKQTKTPFVVAVNKVDRLQYWTPRQKECFLKSFSEQIDEAQAELDERLYELIGLFYEQGFSAERFDRISDFTKNIALVPICAVEGEGIPELLLMLVGLAQRFLEKTLATEEGPAEGTVLEVKDVKGWGKTIDVIVTKGTLKKGDGIVIATPHGPVVTKVRGIMRPKPLDEIRDPRDRFSPVEEVSAAAGIKIVAPDLDNVVSGGPLRSTRGRVLKDVVEEMREAMEVNVELADQGVMIKADAVGSIEGLAYELKAAEIPIGKAEIGNISRRDVIDFSTNPDPLLRVILAFNVSTLPDAEEELLSTDTTFFQGDIVYKIVENYVEWRDKKKIEMENDSRGEIIYPAKFEILPECIFRQSKPVVVGIRVLAGKLRSGARILREDGRQAGTIKSIQSDGKSVKEVPAGSEVAISIDGVTFGRQIDCGMTLYLDIPAGDVKKLEKLELNFDEKDILEQVKRIRRKTDPFWAM
ncbi:MAG: translation initiation factor IF-2 [Candidatus Thermoplasmatota archaeon]|nr:translation initiation factor IF-2 [Candidatus Thermoplasmatota archaeon]